LKAEDLVRALARLRSGWGSLVFASRVFSGCITLVPRLDFTNEALFSCMLSVRAKVGLVFHLVFVAYIYMWISSHATVKFVLSYTIISLRSIHCNAFDISISLINLVDHFASDY
jgi:hypothetical protein